MTIANYEIFFTIEMGNANNENTYRPAEEIKKSILNCISELEEQEKKLHDCIMQHIDEFEEAQKLCNFLKDRCTARGEKLKELSRAKTRFVMEVSHELKAPLAAIQSLLQVILKGYVKTPEKQMELIERAYNRAGELLSLVKDMLDLTRIELHPNTLPMRCDDLHSIIVNVSREFEEKAAARNIVVKNNLPDSIPPVMINRPAIKRVLENLISNAIKYNKDGGNVEIIAKNVDDKFVEVIVSDTGFGIPDEEIPKLFEIFFRGKTASNTKREGTGLGLSMTKKIIDAHGGKIWVESELNKGSKFHFTVRIDKNCEKEEIKNEKGSNH